LAEHLKELREELIPPSSKSNTAPLSAPRVAEDSRPSPLVPSGGGIVGGFRELVGQQSEVGALNQAYRETRELLAAIRELLVGRSRDLEGLQTQHMELNKQVQAAYDRVYDLLKAEGS